MTILLDSCIFTSESVSEKKLKIGQHLAKLWTILQWLVFDSQCSVRRIVVNYLGGMVDF